MKRYPRPARINQIADYDLTEQGQRAALPNTSLAIEVTRRGQGEYLPTQGQFLQGEDDRRHTFSFEECSLGGFANALAMMIHYPDAYADNDDEWEELAWAKMENVLRLKALMGRPTGF